MLVIVMSHNLMTISNRIQKEKTMSALYEDNFGFYAVNDDPEELAFFLHIKEQSIAKKCVRCKKKVVLVST